VKPERAWVVDGLAAGVAGAALGGLPSTLHALATGGDPLEATLAAGAMLLPRERRRLRLVLAAVPVHLSISIGWGLVLARLLPRGREPVLGAAAGLGVAALDLGLVARLFPRVRALPLGPQLTDHMLYGAVAGAVLARRRCALEPPGPER
jgi:hypothetical protein